MAQSQKHGFDWENEIRMNVFNLKTHINDTNVHDIPKEQNIYDNNENISIKTTGSSVIYCGDLLSFYSYDFSEKNTIIVVAYSQSENHKCINVIYEIDYNKELHKLLFGDLTREIIEQYINNVKSIPINTKGEEGKKTFDYIKEKENLKKYNHLITINPKVDSHTQRRVQCSINLKKSFLKDFIKYKSHLDRPNVIRGKEIVSSIESSKRKRGDINISQLKQNCRDNNIKGYSKLNKAQLEDLLLKHNIKFMN